MKFHAGMFLNAALVLLMGVKIIQDDTKVTVGKSGYNAVREAKKLDAAAAF